MAKTKKRITATLVIEPPYTSFAVLTFGGGANGGVALTSKPLSINNNSVVYIGEGGGVQQMTRPEAKRRGITNSTENKK